MQDYKDREHAGMVLAKRLRPIIKTQASYLILAIPNGGIAVAEPIAREFKIDLDIIIVRKLQIPNNPEAGFGALTSFGNVILNENLLRRLDLDKETIEQVIHRTQAQITERKKAYSDRAGYSDPAGKNIILVDDGLASGYTMLAAIQSLQTLNTRSITVAVPTAHDAAVERVQPFVDYLVCPRVERGWSFAVAAAYQNWYDVPDREVIEILARTTEGSK